MNHWLIRSPYKHRGWDDCLMRNLYRLQGIRNAEASANIGRMQIGDKALYYDNIDEKAVYGILEIHKPPYIDPGTNDSKWMAVDALPVRTLDPPVSLEQLKANPAIATTPIITRPRLSVLPVTNEEFEAILGMTEA